MAAVLLSDIMAQNNNNNSNASDDVKPTILHDFLGRGCAPVTKIAAASDVASASSPSASVSGGGGGGRGGGPVSTTSDLGSERQAGLHLEGVPFYGQKTDFSTSQIRYSGTKRSNSDSIFMAPSREAIPQLRPDFPETSHLMKMLRNVGGERHRWPHEDESFMGMHQMRPTSSSSSLMLQQQQQQPGKPDHANSSKWERAIPVNVGPVLQYPPPAAAQVVQYKYQPVQNRFKDANSNMNVNVNVGPSLISQSAADEGSRTGIKGSGILSSSGNGGGGGGVAEPGGSKQKSVIGNTDSGSTPTRQMTIFYGGQAHVFDDVHPNKADVIMALAGSNGGSWSTSFLPNPPVKPSGGQVMKDGEQKSEEKQ
ncbi:protein TIFY 8 [Lactuca sativa]|uniref:Protein TIFY n=1 Tax=Lactuca sativa TaxID=4236 RepID=A0A9R1V873_LACSA|nr:protein TIFY 8 [Lactuca sativa]KAJ0199965.1 hypothetical protein LSAT_V11C600307570 [Lactuca sativa]